MTRAPTDPLARRRRRGSLPVELAGWGAVTLGVVHMAVATYDMRGTWRAVVGDGWWNTFTLKDPTELPEYRRSLTFWLTPGSFAAPMTALGAHILWSERRGHSVPEGIGWGLIAWGVPFVTSLPASPGWVIPILGSLVVVGARRRRPARAVAARVPATR